MLKASLWCTAAYLTGVGALLTTMRGRARRVPPVLLVAYNVLQVAVSARVALDLHAAVDGNVWGVRGGAFDSPALRAAVRSHLWTKYLDYVDTAVIVLHGRTPSVLHLWHHASVAPVWAWVLASWPIEGTAAYAYGAFCNSCVHALMYSYYAACALGARVPTPAKRAVTTVQIAQFVSCIVHAVDSINSSPAQHVIVELAYHGVMIRLFWPLLFAVAK